MMIERTPAAPQPRLDREPPTRPSPAGSYVGNRAHVQLRSTTGMPLLDVVAARSALGNRAVSNLLGPGSGIAIQRVLRGSPNVRSGAGGHHLTQIEARVLLMRLAGGDVAALAALDPLPGVDPLTTFVNTVGQPAHANPHAQGREYGIIIEHGTEEAHIVVGTSGSVDWAALTTEGRAIAHVHPLVEARPADPHPRRPRAAHWSRRWVAPEAPATGYSFAEVSAIPGLYFWLLPSIGDIAFCAEYRIAHHTVYTPYRYHNDQIVDPHAQPQAPHLSFEITKARQTDDGGYEAVMSAWAGRSNVWTRTATVMAQNAHYSRQTIYALT